MKYNLSLNARNFYKQTNQDIYNCWILDYLRDICVSQNQEIIEKRLYEEKIVWTLIDYQHLINEMPYLTRIRSKSSISRIVNELKNMNYLDMKKGAGNKLYIRMLEKTDSLIFSSKTNTNELVVEIAKIENKKDISEKNNEEIQRIFDLYSKEILPGSRLTTNARKKISTRLKEFELEEIIQVIINFSKDSWWMEHNAKRGITWFFNSEDRTEQFRNMSSKEIKDKEELRRGSLNQ